MATPQFLAQQSQTDASAEREWLAVGKTVFWAFYDGAGNIKVQKSTDQAATFGAAVTVDSTAGDNDVMLNDPLAYDPVTNRLHLLYGRNVDSLGNPPVLCHRYSDDQGATWSAEHVIDNGGARGNNRFDRVGIMAYNGHVSVWYVSISLSTFTTDGSLWLAQSSNGGAAWGAGAAQYAGSSTMPTEPNVAVDGQYGIILWYDPGVVANQAGALYCAVTKDGGQTWGSRVTISSSTIYGRSRPAISNGTILVVANSNFGANIADAQVFRSTDVGTTWQGPVTVATHNTNGMTGSIDHPDVHIVGKQAFVLLRDSGSPLTYQLLISTDQGQTFGSPVTPLTTTGNTDAPKLYDTDDYLITLGRDNTAGKTIWSRLPTFAALPGSLATLDNFNRADEDPLSGGGTWTTGITTATPLKLAANTVQREQASGVQRRDGSYYNAVTITANAPQSVKVTVSQAANQGEGDLYLWNKGGAAGYHLALPWGGTYQLFSGAAPGGTVLASNPLIPASGDLIELQIDAGDVIGWLTRGGNLYEMFRVADSTARLAFNGGVEVGGNADTTRGLFDDFGIATLVVPSNTAAPTIAGTVSAGQTLSVSSDGTWATANGATPMRWAYQWQTSPDGITWTNVTGATLPFFTVADATKQHRCVVTATNTIGSTAANSPALQSSALASAFFAAV